MTRLSKVLLACSTMVLLILCAQNALSLPTGWTLGALDGHTTVTNADGLTYVSPTATVGAAAGFPFEWPASPYAGFKVATGAEMGGLFSAFQPEGAMSFLSTFGSTKAYSSGGNLLNWGLFEPTPGGVGHEYGLLEVWKYITGINGMKLRDPVPSTSGYNMSYAGVWLTSDKGTNPVPEPGTVLLLGAGFFGLVALRRKYTR